MPIDWSKISLFTFEAYFLTKLHENWMRHYSCENTFNDIFYFSVSVIKLEFQPTGFLACHFFMTFSRKLTQMLILILFTWALGSLTEKQNKTTTTTKKTMQFSTIKIRICIIFYAFTIKTDFRNISENGKFKQKNRAKPSQSAYIATFFIFQKKVIIITTVFFEKRKSLIDFLL